MRSPATAMSACAGSCQSASGVSGRPPRNRRVVPAGRAWSDMSICFAEVTSEAYPRRVVPRRAAVNVPILIEHELFRKSVPTFRDHALPARLREHVDDLSAHRVDDQHLLLE